METETRKQHGIIFRFSVIFIVFAVLGMFATGLTLYISQRRTFEAQCRRDALAVGDYLRTLIENDSEEFVVFREYMMTHHDEIVLPVDFTSDTPFYEAFLSLYIKACEDAGRDDLTFAELPEEAKKAFATYMQAHLLLLFEEARESFSTPYTYFVMPTGQTNHVYYIVDITRDPEETADGGTKLHLWDDYPESREENKVMWATIESGEAQDGFDRFNNEYGITYSFYLPLVVDGENLGIVCVDVDANEIETFLTQNTFRQIFAVAIILALFLSLLLFIIDRLFIRRITALRKYVKAYSEDKDPAIREKLSEEIRGGDEIAALSAEFSAMIGEIESYVENLINTKVELFDTKKMYIEVSEMALKDNLTGAKNRLAYDQKATELDIKIGAGTARFSVIMIDLNYLKKINDEYGHECGNKAIVNMYQVIRRIFTEDEVYRIGGDEFVALLTGERAQKTEALVTSFEVQLLAIMANEALEPWDRVSAAIGYAKFDPEEDETTEDVFRRADGKMYSNKKAKRASREG